MGKRARGKEVKGKKTKDMAKSKIYIFCEGNTEEIYLTHFQNRTYNVEIVPIDPKHTDAVSIVRYAKQYLQKNELELEYGDRGYCVFDSDPASNPNISEAFQLLAGTREKGLDCIFSNPSFEVWFALHFGNVPYGKSAEQMKHHVKKLFKDELGIQDYCETTDVFFELQEKQKDAYIRAKQLQERQARVYNVHSHECNPYTDMFVFIEYMEELKERNQKRE